MFVRDEFLIVPLDYFRYWLKQNWVGIQNQRYFGWWKLL